MKKSEVFKISRMRLMDDDSKLLLGNELAHLVTDVAEKELELAEYNKIAKAEIKDLKEQVKNISENLSSGECLKEIEVYLGDDDQGRRCHFDALTDEFVEFVGQPSGLDESAQGNLFGDVEPELSKEKEEVIKDQEDEKE